MIDMIFVGRLVNTHGIKGEVKILSDFKYKDVIFKKDSIFYINGDKYTIQSYRKHKNFDMVMFEGIDDINDVIPLKGCDIYIDKGDYVFDGYLKEELYGKKVYDGDKYIGVLENIERTLASEILVVVDGDKKYLIPYVDEFVQEIDDDIHLKLIKGFIDED